MKDQQRWGVVAKVLGDMGKTIKDRAMMYRALVQVLLTYVSKIWVVADAMMTVVGSFHCSISICITGITEWMVNVGEW